MIKHFTTPSGNGVTMRTQRIDIITKTYETARQSMTVEDAVRATSAQLSMPAQKIADHIGLGLFWFRINALGVL